MNLAIGGTIALFGRGTAHMIAVDHWRVAIGTPARAGAEQTIGAAAEEAPCTSTADARPSVAPASRPSATGPLARLW